LHVGLQHDAVLSPIDPRPAELIAITVRAGVGTALKTALLCYTTDCNATIPAQPAGTLVRYIISATTQDDRVIACPSSLLCAPLSVPPKNRLPAVIHVALSGAVNRSGRLGSNSGRVSSRPSLNRSGNS
jgi:hypothetical protein